MSHPGDLLSALLDGELTPAQRADVLGHLRACGECRAELADVNAARAAMRSRPVLEPRLAGVAARGEAGEGVVSLDAERRTRRRLVPVAWAAAVAVAAVLGVGAMRGGDADGGPIDIAQVVDQHMARTAVDPGLDPFPGVQVVLTP